MLSSNPELRKKKTNLLRVSTSYSEDKRKYDILLINTNYLYIIIITVFFFFLKAHEFWVRKMWVKILICITYEHYDWESENNPITSLKLTFSVY